VDPAKYLDRPSISLLLVARREPCGMWRRQSPSALGGGFRTMGLLATPEPSSAGVGLVPRDRGRHQSPPAPGGRSRTVGYMATPEPSLDGRRARCHGTHHYANTVPHREAGLEPRDVWQHQSPPSLGGDPGVTGHVATPKPSRAGLVCRGIRSVGYR
jgi:hypothetical protein